jgi:hypothetical protein
MRRRYSDEAFLYIPKLFALVDRNPYSPTYGSFDRAFWHYRTMDFPCGMNQEFVLPLALAYRHPFPDNPYFGKERVRDLALAGVDFAARSAHPDGSCDDYFPFEQALGAAVFSLYAMSETCLTLDDRLPARIEFLSRRADLLLRYQETGRLTNHQALAALALYNLFILTGRDSYREGAAHRVEICREWQNAKKDGSRNTKAPTRVSFLHDRFPCETLEEKRRRFASEDARSRRAFRVAFHAPRWLLRGRIRQPQHVSFLSARLRDSRAAHSRSSRHRRSFHAHPARAKALLQRR